MSCRTPQGVRGLKHKHLPHGIMTATSHSARSAWIETVVFPAHSRAGGSHSARSAWIETFHFSLVFLFVVRRTPQGVRGLKPHGTI